SLLKHVAIAAGDQELTYFVILSRPALQGKEVGFDDGLAGRSEFDQDIADHMNVAGTAFEDPARPLEEPFDRTRIWAVLVRRIRPVTGTKRGFISAIDAAAIAVDAIADRLPVEQLGDLLLRYGHIRAHPSSGAIRPRASAAPLTTATISCAVGATNKSSYVKPNFTFMNLLRPRGQQREAKLPAQLMTSASISA